MDAGARAARAAERRELAHTLALAFEHDPVFVWAIPDDGARVARTATLYRELLRRGLADGHVDTNDARSGAAVWFAPRPRRPGAWDQLRLGLAATRAFRGQASRVGAAFAALDSMHPKAPHWYLSLLGAHPEHQGTGVGSMLLRARLAECDANGMLAYLETATEQNVAFYERRGFAVRESLRLGGDGPTMWLMERPPA